MVSPALDIESLTMAMVNETLNYVILPMADRDISPRLTSFLEGSY